MQRKNIIFRYERCGERDLLEGTGHFHVTQLKELDCFSPIGHLPLLVCLHLSFSLFVGVKVQHLHSQVTVKLEGFSKIKTNLNLIHPPRAPTSSSVFRSNFTGEFSPV